MTAPLSDDPTAGALSLALAVVAQSAAPLLLLDAELRVLAVSASFSRAFRLEPSSVLGRVVFDLGGGEWNMPRLRSLLGVTLGGGDPIDAYELDLELGAPPPRRLVLQACRLDYADADQVRLLLTATDVTEARLQEQRQADLLREKAILLQEIQHRVANSLQIIASVIMQSARRVQSEEARSNLRDAHHRVISVATVQQYLGASRVGEVELRPYFTQLCHSLAASMILDPIRLTLKVDVDDSTTTGEASVSMGLIVTELVINALKHGFPDHRSGVITVAFKSEGGGWRLSVTDDGVGMSKQPGGVQPRLGSTIVEALARQLLAQVRITDMDPGVRVAIEHAPGGAAAMQTAI